jgi:uncharacterized protein YbjT (DUF2867 family)
VQKVLVAGATGYLGKFVVQEFNRRGYWVRALARNPGKLNETGTFQEPAIADQVSEVFTGQVTEPETLPGLCDGIDIVFSSVGITRQKDKLTYRDVDYQGNRNILDIALTKPVKKFIYVSVFNAHLYKDLAIIRAHEDFVRDLQDCGLDYTVIRPTGYFSDMTEFFTMAKSGRVYLIGNGENKINPVHGVDLAKICVDAVTDKAHEIPVGGPVTYRMMEIADLAFSALGKKPKVTRIPLWVAKLSVRLIRPFNKQLADLADFFLAAGQGDGVAPVTGRHTLDSYYRELAYHSIQR